MKSKPLGVILYLAGIIFLSAGLFALPAFGLYDSWSPSYLPLVLWRWPPPSPTPGPGRLVISEVLYDPPDVEPDGEWVEVYNAGGYPLDISGYKLGDEETRGQGEGMLQFPAKVSLSAGQALLIANRASVFISRYGFPPDFEMRESDPMIPNLARYAPWSTGSVSFDDAGDEVVVLDVQDQFLDAVSWGNSTFAFDPSIPKVGSGHSIERNPAYQDRDLAVDWIDQPIPAPRKVDIPTLTPTPSPTFVSPFSPTPHGPVDLLISEVCYDPPGVGEPATEWLELYNPGESTVSLAGVKLGDEEIRGQGEGMYRFPDSAELLPGKVVVVANQADLFEMNYGFKPGFELTDTDPAVADLSDYRNWATGSLNLSNLGDEVLLLSSADQLIDAVSWGNSVWALDPPAPVVVEGHSLERKPAGQDTDTKHDWVDQPAPRPGEVDLVAPSATPRPTLTPTLTFTPTPTQTPSPTPTRACTSPPPGHLLISEVLYDPVGAEPDGEWIELHNPGATILDLTNFKVGDEETFKGSEGMLSFPNSTQLTHGQTLVVANDALVFQSRYGFLPDFEIFDAHPQVPNLEKYIAWGSGSINLNNTEDEILVLDAFNCQVDALSWGSSTWAFDPSAPRISEGHALERRPANIDLDIAADWTDQPAPIPGAICLENCGLASFR